ncbi:putative odorant receptor 92a [Colletes gigas]|uniref:putative odorant receptor 92a n=1 Tax=Colletes gigas TaxID=935657 RepID=UPI001C9B414B|nr:putative odorant receptor 92a [Colletes gigas]
MKESSNTSIDYYILPNKITCSIAGMWPIDENSSTSRKLFAYFRLLFALTAVSNVFVPEILAIVVNWGDIQVLAGVGCVLTTVGQLLYKMIYLVARRERVYWLYNELRDLWDSSNDLKERQSYQKLAYQARTITIVFYFSCLCNVFTFTIAAAVDYIKIEYNINNGTYKNRHLPFEVWYGTNVTDSPQFEIAFICQVISSMICCAGISGLDATFVTIILHVCGQFKLINTWIDKIGIEINCESMDANYLSNLEENLTRCICHHQRMINVVNNVNNLLTPIIFVQLLTSGVEICLSGFAVTDNNGTRADQLKCISYLISMWIQLVLWCWAGEILVNESQRIGHTIYLNVSWYSLPPIYQKQLYFIIVRTQQYCSIKALTFQTLSINTLTSVFNTAASYFTLLRQVQDK